LKHSCFNYAKNEEKQKPRFLLFVVEKGQDGLFQHPVRLAGPFGIFSRVLFQFIELTFRGCAG